MAKFKAKKVENIEITGIADQGMSVGRTPEGEVIFVFGAVPGDIVDVVIYKKRKKTKIAKVEHFKKLSPQRLEPFCKHFTECGGCKWQNLSYEEQLRQKHTTVSDAMKRIGRLENLEIAPVLGSMDQKYYRNKLEFTFSSQRWYTQEEIDNSGELDKEPALGFHIAGSFSKILDIEECYLQNDLSNKIRNYIRSFCIDHQLNFFNTITQEGFMRTMIVRNTQMGEWMLIIAVTRDDQKKIKLLCKSIMEEFPFITSLYYVINGKKNDFLLDLDFHLYEGKPYIVEKLGSVSYKIGPKSFFQTNSIQAKALFDTVVNFADFKGDEHVYDLYTGLGSIALYIAQHVKSVLGIEEIAAAIEDAKINAAFNKIENTAFYAGDVKNLLTPDFIANHPRPDIIITDPPRAGMHADVVETLLQLSAKKIVYVSCNPATQARDLLLLAPKYDVTKMQPVDMFPHTHHIENIALLELRD
ncbi:MAG TPA: 23S rRNA (uracil(1939)-C(5))-methyltransferase RlmD [Saprospiraceae bacterium]|nr:23S rRNA (uracil(1939)-C(5))-methyltransferase RlmD [Saprospiraceae bacterium]